MMGILLLLFAVYVYAGHQGFNYILNLPVVVEASCTLEEIKYPCEVRISKNKNVYLTIYVNNKLKYIFIYKEGWIVIYDSKFDL